MTLVKKLLFYNIMHYYNIFKAVVFLMFEQSPRMHFSYGTLNSNEISMKICHSQAKNSTYLFKYYLTTI